MVYDERSYDFSAGLLVTSAIGTSSPFGRVVKQLAITIYMYECYIQPCWQSHKATILLFTLFRLCSIYKDAHIFLKNSKYAFGKHFSHLVVLSRLRNSTLIRHIFICRIRHSFPHFILLQCPAFIWFHLCLHA